MKRVASKFGATLFILSPILDNITNYNINGWPIIMKEWTSLDEFLTNWTNKLAKIIRA